MSKKETKHYINIDFTDIQYDIHGNELIIYSIVKNIVNKQDNYFYGSLKYLSVVTGLSIYGTQKILSRLVTKGVIERKIIKDMKNRDKPIYRIKHREIKNKTEIPYAEFLESLKSF